MRTLVCWSGGKDSALALERARSMADLEIAGLLTTLSEEFDRISMHGVRRELLDAQAQALALPVEKVMLPTPPADAACGISRGASGFTVFATNDSYEQRMLEAFARAKATRVEAIVFGDIYLEDLRRYREKLLAQAGLRGVFPLWGCDSRALVEEAIARGFKALVVCVDSKRLDQSWCGRALDRAFLDELPQEVDPSGERGEYHTFVYDGPGFRHAVAVTKGECVLREPFWFCDLAPG